MRDECSCNTCRSRPAVLQSQADFRAVELSTCLQYACTCLRLWRRNIAPWMYIITFDLRMTAHYYETYRDGKFSVLGFGFIFLRKCVEGPLAKSTKFDLQFSKNTGFLDARKTMILKISRSPKYPFSAKKTASLGSHFNPFF